MRRLLSAAACLLAACSDPAGSAGGVRVVPERDAYAVFRPDETVEVRYTLTNTSPLPVYLPPCGQHLAVELDRRDGGAWVPAGPAWYCPAVFSPPVEVGPGESYTDVVPVTGFGTWRVRAAYGRMGGRGEDARIAVSSAFVTRVPPD
jgi:hypothetical protein